MGSGNKNHDPDGTIHEPKSRLSTDPNQFWAALHEADTRAVESPSSGLSLQPLAVPDIGYFFSRRLVTRPFQLKRDLCIHSQKLTCYNGFEAIS